MRDSNKTSAFLRILPALLVAALLVPGCVVSPYHPRHKKVVVHHPRHKKVIVHRPHKQVVVHKHKNEVTVVHVQKPRKKNVTVVNVKGPNGEVTTVTNGKTKIVKVKGKKKGHKKHDDDHPGKGKGHDDD